MSDLSLEKFNPIAELNALVEAARGVFVTDIGDKEQLSIVKKTRILLRDARIDIEKKGKELRGDALAFQKAVIAREKELIAIIEPEEARLAAIEDEVKAKKLRAERIALIPERRKRIGEIGGDTLLNKNVSDEQLVAMDASEFQGYVNAMVADKNEKDRKAIEARENAAKEEELRLQREKEAQEREERARQEEREAGERRLAAETERLQREAREKTEREEREKKAEEERLEAERKRIEADAKYQAFLKEHGVNEETRHKFHIERSGNVVRLYTLIDEINLNA